MTLARLLLLAALAVLLAAAGCGGESKGDVVREGDAICREANDKLEQLEEPETLSGLPEYAGEARPIFQDALADLKELDPPPEDKAAFDEYIAKSEELSDLLEEIENAGPDATDSELQEMSDRIGEISDEQNAAAAEYGFEDCAE